MFSGLVFELQIEKKIFNQKEILGEKKPSIVARLPQREISLNFLSVIKKIIYLSNTYHELENFAFRETREPQKRGRKVQKNEVGTGKGGKMKDFCGK